MENILDLPNEMLQHILLFVPKRYDVALVCHNMYENVCAVEAYKCILKTVSSTDEHKFIDELLPSIMKTKRVIDEIHLILPNLMITKQILGKFGQNMKKVKFMMKLKLKLDEFIELTTLMPNLQEICFNKIDIIDVDEIYPLSCDGASPVLNLPKLRIVNIISEDLLQIFAEMLPTNILEVLCSRNCNPQTCFASMLSIH